MPIYLPRLSRPPRILKSLLAVDPYWPNIGKIGQILATFLQYLRMIPSLLELSSSFQIFDDMVSQTYRKQASLLREAIF